MNYIGRELVIEKNGFGYRDYYKEARDAYLSKIFSDYPNLKIDILELQITVSGTAKNGPLVYSLLDSIPNSVYSIDKNLITISFSSEEEVMDHIEWISDMLLIVRSWKSTELKIDGISRDLLKEFGYFSNYLFEKHGKEQKYFCKTIGELKKKYSTRKRTTKKKEPTTRVLITRENVTESLEAVVGKYIELYGKNKEIKQFEISEHDKIVMVENDLIVDFRALPWYWARFDDENAKEWEFPYISIQELTHNDLYNFNFSDFKRHFVYDYIGIDFYPFHGVHYYRDEIDNYNVVDRCLPELNLKKRNDEYPGENHHFVILRMEGKDGKFAYGIGDTKGKVHSFVLKLCKELEEKNPYTLEHSGASSLSYRENQKFLAAFASWKGEKKRWRLENKFSYYYVDKMIKNDLELFSVPSSIIEEAENGAFDGCEFGVYNKPINRWKSEELVYNITKKLYSDYQVIYQYRPFFLSTDNGNMSYDIYICGLKIAIEYQGKQHFEPVDYFGGKDNYEKQKFRDNLKAERSKENGVKLIYVNYWEDITPNLIKHKIEDALASKDGFT